MDSQSKTKKKWQSTLIQGFIVLVAILITAGVSWFLYEHTVNLLTDNLRQRLLSIGTTQVANIDPSDVEKLQKEDDWKRPEWARVVGQLKRAKNNNSNIVFMYIFRKKGNDATQMEFVADAESINPYANIDTDSSNDVDANGDGKIEPDGADQLQWPGQDYPEPPDEAFLAYDGPLTNKDLYADAYGQVLTGYAPIKNGSGKVIAILGTDIKANDFFTVTRQTLYPFLAFIILLIGILLILASSLIKIWSKQVDLIVELDRQKDSVLHMVAHQFKGPVSTINFTTELLLDGTYGKLSPEQQENVNVIRTASQKMGSQSEMVLDAAKITLGKLPLEPKPVELDQLFKEVVKEAETHAKERKVNLKVVLPNEPLPTATLDRRYTQLAFDNLLSNAIKYTALKAEGGSAEFIVQMQGKTLRASVKDTGIGIPKAEQDNIFKELYRASNAGKDGNGLGLHVTKGAIEAQGGKLWFESEEGKGTTFFVELPLNS